LVVFEEGIYSVKVTNSSGCKPDHVTASNIATIQTIDIADIDNTVTVNVTGSGNYEYSLNDPYGPFQSSNFFDNVPAGIHEVYVNDKMDVVLSANAILERQIFHSKWRRI
jgi:hypothetical protein